MKCLMRSFWAFAVLLTISGTVLAIHAQDDGIGGVLVRDVPIPNNKGEWPQILPAGGLVAFGSGSDWSSSNRENGWVLVRFIIKEEDGDLDSGYVRIPEDSVQVFNWACGRPSKTLTGTLITCSPFTTTVVGGPSNEWQLRFVSEGRKLARQLGLELIEEFSPAYKGGASAAPDNSTRVQGLPPTSSSKCTVDQILKMKDAGLSDAQIKAACNA